MLLLPGFFMTVLGGLILLFYPDPNFDWGFYVAMGVFLYAFVLLLYGPLSFFRLRRQSAEIED
jgi:membrane protein implicated in regulation of membrane protease activity